MALQICSLLYHWLHQTGSLMTYLVSCRVSVLVHVIMFKNVKTCSISSVFIETELNYVVFPSFFIIVNNVEQHC